MKDRPWIWLIILAIFMLSGSAALIHFSGQMKTETVPLDAPPTHHP